MFRVEIVEKKTIEKLEKAVNNILISKGGSVAKFQNEQY